jgi:hypothetical protein
MKNRWQKIKSIFIRKYVKYTTVTIAIVILILLIIKKGLKFDPNFSISSFLEIMALVFMAWEIRSTRKNLFIKNDLKAADFLSSLIAQITHSLGDPNLHVMNGNINDEKCRKLFNDILMHLNEEKRDEKELIDCLNRYKTEQIIIIPDWIEDIIKYGNKIITNYKKRQKIWQDLQSLKSRKELKVFI